MFGETRVPETLLLLCIGMHYGYSCLTPTSHTHALACLHFSSGSCATMVFNNFRVDFHDFHLACDSLDFCTLSVLSFPRSFSSPMSLSQHSLVSVTQPALAEPAQQIRLFQSSLPFKPPTESLSLSLRSEEEDSTYNSNDAIP
jgi:hypothetical protein